MTVTLLPRLNQISVDYFLDGNSNDFVFKEAPNFIDDLPESIAYAASGGSVVDPGDLLELREQLLAIAVKFNFPRRGSVRDRARFDSEAAEALGEHRLFTLPESLRDDVWAFVATVVLPDVVVWRFGTSSRDRFHGGVRNTFQRLWLRAWALDRGVDHKERWGLLSELSEDAFVQIVERPSIGGERRLALAFAEGWLRTATKLGRERMQDIMRYAVIAFRVRNQVQLMVSVSDDQLRGFVDNAFMTAQDIFAI